MRFNKPQILQEIVRIAKLNGGVAPGIQRFSMKTGIRESEMLGVFWARWNDALKEAGLPPNCMKIAYGKKHLLRKYAELAREIGGLPVRHEMELKRRSDPDFASLRAYDRCFGTMCELHGQTAEFCRNTQGLEVVADYYKQRYHPAPTTAAADTEGLVERSTGAATPE